MYKKLVVLVILIFSITLWLTLSNKKTKIAPPFHHYLPDAEMYGKVSTNEIIAIIKRFVIRKNNVFTISDTEFDYVLERFNKLGLSNEQIYFTGNTTREDFGVYIKVKELDKIKQELSELAYTFDWEEIKSEEYTIYFQENNNFFFILHPKAFIFKFGDALKTPDNKLLKDEPTPERFYDLDTLFQQNNSFAIQTKKFNGLGIHYLLANFSLKDTVSIELTLKSIDTLPLKLKEEGIANRRNDEEDININLNLNVSGLTINEQWGKEMQKLSQLIGLAIKPTLSEWNGNLSFRQGGETEVTETIIELNFNENFEEVEEIKVIKKSVTCFEIILGTNNPSNMEKALQSNGFLSKQKQHYFLPFSPPLFVNKQTRSLILSSSNNYSQESETLDKSAYNSFYYHNNYFKIIAKIKSIQSDELTIDASITVVDVEE